MIDLLREMRKNTIMFKDIEMAGKNVWVEKRTHSSSCSFHACAIPNFVECFSFHLYMYSVPAPFLLCVLCM